MGGKTEQKDIWEFKNGFGQSKTNSDSFQRGKDRTVSPKFAQNLNSLVKCRHVGFTRMVIKP